MSWTRSGAAALDNCLVIFLSHAISPHRPIGASRQLGSALALYSFAGLPEMESGEGAKLGLPLTISFFGLFRFVVFSTSAKNGLHRYQSSLCSPVFHKHSRQDGYLSRRDHY